MDTRSRSSSASSVLPGGRRRSMSSDYNDDKLDVVRQREAAVDLARRILKQTPPGRAEKDAFSGDQSQEVIRRVFVRNPPAIHQIEEIERVATRALTENNEHERRSKRCLHLSVGFLAGFFLLLFLLTVRSRRSRYMPSSSVGQVALDCDISFLSEAIYSKKNDISCGVSRSSLFKYRTRCPAFNLRVVPETRWIFAERTSPDLMPSILLPRTRYTPACRQDNHHHAILAQVSVTTSPGALRAAKAFSFGLSNFTSGLLHLDLDDARLKGLTFFADPHSPQACTCEIKLLS